MTTCERFESEALLLLERGEPIDDHFSSCPVCLSLKAIYERLRESLSSLGEADELPVGWQAGVWQRIEQRRERRRGWRSWWLAPAAVAAVLSLVLVRPPQPGAPGLRVEVESSAAIRRGVEAHPGDQLRLVAATGGAENAELRVYRNDHELILRCSTEPPCSRWRGELRANVLLDGIGRYQPLLLFSAKPLPASAIDLETDTSAALAAGAEVELGTEVVVR